MWLQGLLINVIKSSCLLLFTSVITSYREEIKSISLSFDFNIVQMASLKF